MCVFLACMFSHCTFVCLQGCTLARLHGCMLEQLYCALTYWHVCMFVRTVNEAESLPGTAIPVHNIIHNSKAVPGWLCLSWLKGSELFALSSTAERFWVDFMIKVLVLLEAYLLEGIQMTNQDSFVAQVIGALTYLNGHHHHQQQQYNILFSFRMVVLRQP